MELGACKATPYVLMVLVQFCFSGMSFLTEAAFDTGLNPYVYVTYRHLLVAFVLGPVAFYMERAQRPPMSWRIFIDIFLLSALGASVGPCLYFASLGMTSPTFVTSIINCVPAITFSISVILRKEIARVKSLHGFMKVMGTVLSLAGATTMALYKGPAFKLKSTLYNIAASNLANKNWVAGSICAAASCICWSGWFVLQVYSVERYPAPLSLTSFMCLVGGIQSAIFTLITQQQKDWHIGMGIDLWCIVYSGIVCSGFTILAQLWCTKKRGCVFVTMFDPLAAVIVAVLAFFVFGERIYMGSIIGALVVMLGLYMLLWGKGKEERNEVNGVNLVVVDPPVQDTEAP